MKYIDKPIGDLKDRASVEPNITPIDVIMLTLDAENFLEKSLYSIYREIPIRRLLVCDGGSKDQTVKILEKFPRVEIKIRPDIRTGGKSLEFLISLAETERFLLIDSDIELERGWYDEMSKHQDEYDVLENSRMILAYHMYREDKNKLEKNQRSSDLCHLIKKEAVKNYHCDDDYMWRFTDYLLRQSIEKSGYTYGKIDSTSHVHHETERTPYESDKEKNFSKIVWDKPQIIITNHEKAKQYDIKHAKAVVKYLDPNHPTIKENKGLDLVIRLLDRKWVEDNGPAWLVRYDKKSNMSSRIKSKIKNIKNK